MAAQPICVHVMSVGVRPCGAQPQHKRTAHWLSTPAHSRRAHRAAACSCTKQPGRAPSRPRGMTHYPQPTWAGQSKHAAACFGIARSALDEQIEHLADERARSGVMHGHMHQHPLVRPQCAVALGRVGQIG